MGVADKSAAKISRNSRKLKQSSMGVADKSTAKIYRNSRKLSSLLMDVVMIYFYSKRFRFAPSFNHQKLPKK